MEVVIGSVKKQYSIGPDSEELRSLIKQQKSLYADGNEDARAREKLVSMLHSGGLYTPGRTDGRVIEYYHNQDYFCQEECLLVLMH